MRICLSVFRKCGHLPLVVRHQDLLYVKGRLLRETLNGLFPLTTDDLFGLLLKRRLADTVLKFFFSEPDWNCENVLTQYGLFNAWNSLSTDTVTASTLETDLGNILIDHYRLLNIIYFSASEARINACKFVFLPCQWLVPNWGSSLSVMEHVTGNFAVRYFVVGYFAVGYFAIRKFRRKEISP